MAGKPRILQSNRDMVWSLVPLLLICIAIAVISGNVSFGTNTDDKVPAYDVTTGLKADARTMPFPLRLPATPDGWKPNSGSTTPIGDKQSSNAGYLTTGGVYLQLTQTNADESATLAQLAGREVTGQGTVDLGGRSWVKYAQMEGKKKVWITDLGDVRIALFGQAEDAEFTTLANAVLAVAPLPKS